MKKKDILKIIKEKKKPKYHWEKEGKELIQKIEQKNYDKEELKQMLSKLLLREIPENLIFDFWFTCSGAKAKMNENKGQYKKLVKAFNYLIEKKHPFFLNIQKKIATDLNGTFNQNNIKVTQHNIDQLRDILYAFTIRNVSINYCQGFNVIVGHLLLMTNFKEEESFYLFLILMENILPHDYFLFGIGVDVDYNIIMSIFEKYDSDLLQYLNEKQGIGMFYSAIIKDITYLFNCKMHKNITNILFNCYYGFALLSKKDEVFFFLHKIIIGIMRFLKEKLLKCKNNQQFNDTLSLEKEIKKDKLQIIIYYALFDEEINNQLDINNLKKIRKEKINQKKKDKKFSFDFNNKNNIKCNIIYPICIEEGEISICPELKVVYKKLNYNKNEKNEDEQKNKIIINNDEEYYEKLFKEIIIERRKHYCLIKQIVNKYNYCWEKEGKEIIQKINENNYKNPEELKKILSILLLKEDIPNNLIIDFWLSCSGARTKMNENKGQYKKLVKAFNILVKNNHPFFLHIKKKISIDLNRSFNNSKVKTTPEIINQLRDILYAFATRNVSINYCQGINAVVAFLLQMTNFKEEESFYLFLTIMEKVLPHEYYLFGIGVEAESNVIMKLLEKYKTELFQHINQIGGTGILFSIITQFVTSLFIFQMDRNISTFVFNCFFGFFLLEESFFYFYKIILSIIKFLEDDLLKCKDMREVNDIVSLNKSHTREDIQRIIFYTFFDDTNTLDLNYTKQLRNEEINKVIKNNKYKFNFKNNDKIKCNLNYPICVEEYNNQIEIEYNVNYTKNNNDDKSSNINIINDNENENDNEKDDDDDDDDNILKNIVIERRKHYCN